MSSIVYDYYPFEVEIRDNNLYFFIITNRSEKKMLFSSSLNTDFDKLCDSLIKCITTDVKKQIPKEIFKSKGVFIMNENQAEIKAQAVETEMKKIFW